MVFFPKLLFSIQFIKEWEAFHQVIPNPFPTTECFLKICWGLIENFIKNHIQLFVWQIRKGDRHCRGIRNPQSEFGLIDVECNERCTQRTPGFTITSYLYPLWLKRCRCYQYSQYKNRQMAKTQGLVQRWVSRQLLASHYQRSIAVHPRSGVLASISGIWLCHVAGNFSIQLLTSRFYRHSLVWMYMLSSDRGCKSVVISES